MDNSEDSSSNGYMGNRAHAAGLKDENVECAQAPFAMDGQHTYEIEGKCIYCGERKPEAKETTRNAKPKCPGMPTLSMDAVNALMCTFQMYGHILAAQARIDGMKVSNTVSMSNGDTFPPYGQEAFRQEATNIESYARHLRVMQIEKPMKKFFPGGMIPLKPGEEFTLRSDEKIAPYA
jgi:hypothetical protein